MKQLKGTEKQVEWAEKIRKETLEALHTYAPTERGNKVIDHLENKIGNAEWWIGVKSLHPMQIAAKIVKAHGY